VRDREGGCASNEVSYVRFTVLKFIHSWLRKCLMSRFYNRRCALPSCVSNTCERAFSSRHSGS
jgi:hypothetical protein